MGRALLVGLCVGCSLPDTQREEGAPRPELVAREQGTLVVEVTGADGLPLAGATVVVEPHGFEGLTDGDGVATLSGLPVESATAWVSAAGHFASRSDPTTPTWRIA
jgi:hypothetical protein